MIIVRFLALIVACCVTGLVGAFGGLVEPVYDSIFVDFLVPVLVFVFFLTYAAVLPFIRDMATRA